MNGEYTAGFDTASTYFLQDCLPFYFFRPLLTHAAANSRSLSTVSYCFQLLPAFDNPCKVTLHPPFSGTAITVSWYSMLVAFIATDGVGKAVHGWAQWIIIDLCGCEKCPFDETSVPTTLRIGFHLVDLSVGAILIRHTHTDAAHRAREHAHAHPYADTRTRINMCIAHIDLTFLPSSTGPSYSDAFSTQSLLAPSHLQDPRPRLRG